MSKPRSGTLLDVDSSIIEKNLLLDEFKSTEKDELSKLFPGLAQETCPSKLVRPTPGFCIKTRSVSGGKVFVNVCQTDAIPAPRDVSETELAQILVSEEAMDYRVPMSIGNPRTEPDKSGVPSDVYDVAVNKEFLRKVDQSILFRNFLLQVVFEGVQQKYELELTTEEFVVLKNRKAVGVLQQHRIQQRDFDATMPPRCLIEEIGPASDEAPTSSLPSRRPKKPAAVVQSKSTASASLERTISTYRQPEYRLLQEPSNGPPSRLVGHFRLSDVLGAREVALDVGEDRIVLESRRHGYLLDVFVPCRLDPESTEAVFDVEKSMLTITASMRA